MMHVNFFAKERVINRAGVIEKQVGESVTLREKEVSLSVILVHVCLCVCF